MKGGWVYIVTNKRDGTLYGAIASETRMKKWPRAWKVRLIHEANPDWDDLFEELNQ